MKFETASNTVPSVCPPRSLALPADLTVIQSHRKEVIKTLPSVAVWLTSRLASVLVKATTHKYPVRESEIICKWLLHSTPVNADNQPMKIVLSSKRAVRQKEPGSNGTQVRNGLGQIVDGTGRAKICTKEPKLVQATATMNLA